MFHRSERYIIIYNEQTNLNPLADSKFQPPSVIRINPKKFASGVVSAPSDPKQMSLQHWQHLVAKAALPKTGFVTVIQTAYEIKNI